MTRRIVPDSARLDVFKPDNATTDPDFTVPAEHIRGGSDPESVGPLKDQAKFTLDNRDGQYRRGNGAITGGDRVEFWIALGPSGGVGIPQSVVDSTTDAEAIRRHTGVVRNPSVEVGLNDCTLSFTAEDFVGFVLANRVIEAGFENRQVAGTEDSILERVLREKCPEIDRSRIEPIETTTTITYNATTVTKAVRRLLARGDVVMTSDGRALVTRPKTSLDAKWTLSEADYSNPLKFDSNDDGMSNAVRLDGGEATAVYDSQYNVDGWQTVTKSNRLVRQLDMPKAEVTTVQVWTDPTRTASGDGVKVRLQKNDDGTPVGLDDDQLDFATHTLADEFLEHDGFTKFLMPEHDIVDPDPWLIIEADGAGDESGQAIGVNVSGVPAYEALYPYPVSARVEDAESIEEYRRRETQLADDSLHTLSEVATEARAILTSKNSLDQRLSFEASSIRAHELQPGEAIHVESWEAGVAADYVVIKRDDSYEGGSARLTTKLTLQDIETL